MVAPNNLNSSNCWAPSRVLAFKVRTHSHCGAKQFEQFKLLGANLHEAFAFEALDTSSAITPEQ